MKKAFLCLLFVTVFYNLKAQKHTVGLVKADINKAFAGYTLIYPDNQPNVYLLNTCGQIVHTWTDTLDSRPGNVVHLLEDGSILKTKRNANTTQDALWAEGGGGTVEWRDWNNTLLWSFTLNDSFNRLHHDIEPMPNGNILMVSWEKKTKAEAIAKGRIEDSMLHNEIWVDKIIEVKPLGKDGYTIVWEWHLWDHLLQSVDSTKPNYGNPLTKIGRVDINYAIHSANKHWASIHSLNYNDVFDQIVVSSPWFNEAWIIDHSTSSQEAASRLGGFSGKGGDLMFRWGNPAAYKGGDKSLQRLFFPNDVQWMGKKFGDDNFGKFIVANNRFAPNFSTASIFQPVFDTYFWDYIIVGNTYLPKSFIWTYKMPDSSAFYSPVSASVQPLSNGNTLICSGNQGYLFEMDSKKEIIWEYITPLNAGIPVKQGDILPKGSNVTVEAKRYAADFSAFTGRNLMPKGYLENKPDTAFCKLYSNISAIEDYPSLSVFPNPTNQNVTITTHTGTTTINSLSIVSVLGEVMWEANDLKTKSFTVNTSHIPQGLYYLSINHHQVVVKLEVKH